MRVHFKCACRQSHESLDNDCYAHSEREESDMTINPMTRMSPMSDPPPLLFSIQRLICYLSLPNVGEWTPYIHPEGALYFCHSRTVLVLNSS
jgi:hypothetical protein